MIGLDTNIIVQYAVVDAVAHSAVRSWFKTNQHMLATTSINLGEALRLLTHPRAFAKPLTMSAAADYLRQFVRANDVELLEEASTWLDDLYTIADKIPTLRGNDVFDARIALCLRHNGVRRFCTFDDDFSKFDFIEAIHP